MKVSPESGAWDAVRHGWQQLFGDFDAKGVSIESLQCRLPGTMDWGKSFHADSLEICLNLQGVGLISDGRRQIEVGAGDVLFYLNTEPSLKASRLAGNHFFVTLEFRKEFFKRQESLNRMMLYPEIGAWLNNYRGMSRVGALRRMSIYEQELAKSLASPPVPSSCQELWYQGKVMELISHFLFKPQADEGFFCSRQKRAVKDRVETAATLLLNHLEEPPSLEDLARQVGCSPFYLSRLFTEVKGMGITQFLKQARIERAAEYLRQGTHNVTEAAMAVGYSSLSHFTRAFTELMGESPARYARRSGAEPQFKVV
jgi:AraC-like DNA-binding protein